MPLDERIQMADGIEQIMREYGFEFPEETLKKIWNEVVDVKDAIVDKWDKQNA